MGIDDCGTDERETASLHVLADGVGQVRGGGQLVHRPPAVLDRLTIDKAPDIIGERPECGLYLKEGAGILAGAVHLEAIADDGRVLQQLFEPGVTEARYLPGVEVGE